MGGGDATSFCPGISSHLVQYGATRIILGDGQYSTRTILGSETESELAIEVRKAAESNVATLPLTCMPSTTL